MALRIYEEPNDNTKYLSKLVAGLKDDIDNVEDNSVKAEIPETAQCEEELKAKLIETAQLMELAFHDCTLNVGLNEDVMKQGKYDSKKLKINGFQVSVSYDGIPINIKKGVFLSI